MRFTRSWACTRFFLFVAVFARLFQCLDFRLGPVVVAVMSLLMKLLSLVLLLLSVPVCLGASAWFLVLKSKLTPNEKALIKMRRGVRGEVQAALAFLALCFAIFGVFYYGIEYSLTVSVPLLIVVGGSEILDLIHFVFMQNDPSISERSRKAWVAPGFLCVLGVAMVAVGAALRCIYP